MNGRGRIIECLRQYFITYLYCSRFDIVISMSFQLGLGLCFLQLLGLRKKVKHIIFDIASSRLQSSFWRSIFVVLISTASRIICFTSSQENKLSKQISSKKISFISLGVNPEEFVSGINDGKYILSAGRQSRDYATLIEAVKKIGIKTIILAGYDSITRRTGLERLSLPSNVEVHYEIQYEEYKKLLAGSRLVVIPLRNVPYACGQVSLLEAFAARKPVIVTKTSSMVDYVEDGKTGLFVSPNDPKDLELAILSLIRCNDLSEYLSNNARKAIELKFNFQEMSRKLFSIIEAEVKEM